MAKFEGRQLVHHILTKVVFAYKASGHEAMVGSALTSVLAVLVLLHGNGNLWLIPWDSTSALASSAPKRKLVHNACWCLPGLCRQGSRHLNLTR